MNQSRHRKLRASGWNYDPISDRYSAPGVPIDGNQKMYAPNDAWEVYEAAQTKQKPKS